MHHPGIGFDRSESDLRIFYQMVPEAGLEPVRVFPQRILNPTCLPITSECRNCSIHRPLIFQNGHVFNQFSLVPQALIQRR
jgi:hypothetical protein